MESLRFETSLKEVPVTLVDANGVERQCTLKELTGAQRSIYNESFKIKIQMDGDEAKAVPGEDFKTFPAEEFLSMCLYDENGVQISKEVIGAYPTATVEGLHKAALELSGMDKKALEKAKNE